MKPIPESVNESVDDENAINTQNESEQEGSSEIAVRLRLLGKLIIPPPVN